MLAPGRSLELDVVDSSGRILLPRGTPIADEVQVKQLWMRGFLRDDAPGVPASTEPPPPSSWRQRPRAPDGPSSTPRFFQPVERLSIQLEEIFCEILNGKGNGIPERILEFTRAIQVQLARDADAFLASLELCVCTRYGTLHALHSAAICDVVGQAQDIDAANRRILMAAALTRDVGFLELQDELDRQSDGLTSEQQEHIRLHPLASARLLREAKVKDQTWLAAVEQHHERLNGSGYPHGLTKEALPPFSRLLGIADIYSAMTKPRVYRPAIQGPNAIHSIFQTRGALVDEGFTQAFIRVLGLYPPGLMVRLANGELAVITRRTPNLKAPEVRVVADAEEKLLSIYPTRDVADPVFAVVEVVSRTHPLRDRLNHRQLWGEGLATLRR